MLIGVIMKCNSIGPILHFSTRAGQNNRRFRMLKLRTMKPDTPEIPSNLISRQERYFIRFGKFLRNTGIDELPQFINILKGDMSFVGPRPVIISETELITERAKRGIERLKPGLTGLAQINGRDRLSVNSKLKYDEIYMKNMSLFLDIKIILLTNFWLFRENIFNKLRKSFRIRIIKNTD